MLSIKIVPIQILGGNMKIIRRGKKKNPLLKTKITCSECGCQFRLESEKEAELVNDHRAGDYYQVICPQCQHKDTLSVVLL